ncbi:MAG: polysaccharide deacetylase family protein [Candidatus Zhuqueibacterota bacterium]
MNHVAFLKDRLDWQRRSHVSHRMMSILKRYGIGDQRMMLAIFRYLKLVTKYGAVPTFPVTAQVVARHSEAIRRFQGMGAEFAIHGYTHVDYTMLSPADVTEHLSKAVETFVTHGIHYSGFRFPYLKRNPGLFSRLSQFGFCWDSSDTADFDPVPQRLFPEKDWQCYEFMRRDYGRTHMLTRSPLPVLKDNVLEIPVALPDDDLLVDRLLVEDVSFIAACWKKMLLTCFEHGELFVLQLHPERFFICEPALEVLLEMAFRAKSKIWSASLQAIHDWWREKETFRAVVQSLSGTRYAVKIHCTDRGTLLIKNARRLNAGEPLFENYYPTGDRQFEMECLVKPVIGLSDNSPAWLVEHLRESGFIFEMARPEMQYAVDLTTDTGSNSLTIQKLDQRIQQSPHPLLRFWRWPNQARCALSITGDIDCLSSMDFYSRL